MSLVDDIRRRLRERPLLGDRSRFQPFVGGVAVDSNVEKMRDDFRRKWTAQGATPSQIDKALRLADDWAQSLAQFAAADPETQKRIVERIYPRAIETGDRWLQSMRMQTL